ncbi:MAG TPA: GNAT family N-acetyltransferase [Holophagaceae bacterium]|nr:GNAT family N-acetyltransferase [Holophagaceae bacterium]
MPAPVPSSPVVREGLPSDIPEIVRVTNLAYAVEAFCIQGTRTDETDVADRMSHGTFLVVDDPERQGRLRALVHLDPGPDRGYLGTLAVAPGHQGTGLARALVVEAESRCRAACSRFLDLTVVNLRVELFPFYRRLGFAPMGVIPFPMPSKLILPCHLVQMTKALVPDEAL